MTLRSSFTLLALTVACSGKNTGDVNGDNSCSTIAGFEDWPALVFEGGAVGGLGVLFEPPAQSQAEELAIETGDALPRPFIVTARGPGLIALEVEAGTTIEYTVENVGESTDTYDLSFASPAGWTDASGLPADVTLDPEELASYLIPVTLSVGHQPIFA